MLSVYYVYHLGQTAFNLRLIFILPLGRTTLGHGPVDINIQGPGVAAQHCYIENRSGLIVLHPCGNLCAIDGIQVQQPTRLSQGRTLPHKHIRFDLFLHCQQ